MTSSNNKLKPIYILFIFLLVSLNTPAQEAPYAQIITAHQNFCETGETTVEFEIQFFGEPPFGIVYKTPGSTFEKNDPIHTDNLDENYVWQASFRLRDVVPGESFITDTIELLEVFDNTVDISGKSEWPRGTGQSISDQQETFTNWAMPVPFAGETIDSCGLSAILNTEPDQLPGSNYYWQPPSAGSLHDESAPNTTFEASDKGTYSLIFIQENGACSASDTVEINLKGAPSATIETSSQACGTTTKAVDLNLSFWGDGPFEYAISDGNSTVINNISSSESVVETTNINGQTTFSFEWLLDNNGCYARPDDIIDEATVPDIKPNTFAGNDTSVCGQQVVLNATLSSMAQYGSWSANTGSFLNDSEDNPQATFQSDGWGKQTLTWTETNGPCTGRNEIIVHFYEEPTADAGKNLILYHQHETTLEAASPTSSESEWSGQWDIILGDGTIENPTSKNTNITGLKQRESLIEWSVTNGVCPLKSDTIQITVNDLTYYTGISPNAETNKYFKIKGAHTIDNNELIVFDQNGQVVYNKRNLEEGNHWDGSHKDGTPLKSGIYYFVFKGKGIVPIKDYLVIKRN
jgi:hypothetical protein